MHRVLIPESHHRHVQSKNSVRKVSQLCSLRSTFCSPIITPATTSRFGSAVYVGRVCISVPTGLYSDTKTNPNANTKKPLSNRDE